MNSSYVIAIDQGTTSTRSIVFTPNLEIVAIAQQEFPQHFPQSGWVEHDPLDLWYTTLQTLQAVLAKAKVSITQIAGIGITNQRETVIVWDKATGQPIYNAIVWQDRRTASFCDYLVEQGYQAQIHAITGLRADPYFSASKIRWILDHVEGAQAKAEAGQLAIGTVDTWLIWQLTGGKVHATDATNASRTMLYDIHAGAWHEELLQRFKIPRVALPQVKNSADDFGVTQAALVGAVIPICGVAGDQQAALIGQACFAPGTLKSTYGTGCFILLNTGQRAVVSQQNLISTIAYQLNGQATYAIEGSIFVAGAAIQWLRDGLKIIKHASETDALAAQADPKQAVYLVPAFVGLGAPYWDAQARGALYGLTRNTGAAEIARAALESVAYQTLDLVDAMLLDAGLSQQQMQALRVDGGLSASDWAMQFLADMLHQPVDRPKMLETTAKGAAYLAGLQLGLCPSPTEFAKQWQAARSFTPYLNEAERQRKYAGWQQAINRTRTQTH
jgi:glycerol kinase